jgi:uncharacterized protein (TIGR03437 family)
MTIARIVRKYRWAMAAALALTAVAPSQAYYHYIHFLTGKAPFVPIPEAFDLSKLQNKTLTFFVSDAGPSTYGANDSYGSVLSQVRQAAAAWNSVTSSDLRVAFGGVESTPSPVSTAPGGDVVFQELAPGLLGLGAPVVAQAAEVQTGPNGQFFPIQRGLVVLTNNTDSASTYGPGPSYLEEFYTTAVHEFGHALGLQHTWTASAMSQDVIRNTSRARPLDADDIAAISELYGKAGWKANFASISGKVTLGGAAVNMASVVAIPPVGPAVSALTNPDGTYTIDGLPANQYLLYVHPLPPDAVLANGSGLALPVDAAGKASFPRSGYFQTVFYPGTTNEAQATTFTVAAGDALTDENFTVQARSAVPLYDLVTYCYLNTVDRTYSFNYSNPELAIFMTPAFVGADQSKMYIWAAPNSGLVVPVPDSATLLGPDIPSLPPVVYPPVAPKGQPQPQQYMYLGFLNRGAAPGPRHLVLTFNNGTDLYVLPDAVTVAATHAPAINSLTPNSDGSVTVAGVGLVPDSLVFFDGQRAAVTAPFTATDAVSGSISALPPDGVSGQNSTVTVFNADGQNSMLLQYLNPLIYVYPPAPAPQIVSVNPPALPAGFNVDGTASLVDIVTANTNFARGQVTLGFGTPDISVRRVWVIDSTHLKADIVIGNSAVVGVTSVNVISGFQVLTLPGGFQIQPSNVSIPTLALPVYNAVTYATVLRAGDFGAIFGSNLAPTSAPAQVTLNGTAVPVIYSSNSQVNFAIPADYPAGRATLVVNNGAASTLPVVLQIDAPPPVVTSLADASGTAFDTAPVLNPGDVLSVLVTNIDPGVAGVPARLRVTLAGVPMTVLAVTQASAAPAGQPVASGLIEVQFAVTQSFAGSQVPLVVAVDGNESAALTVAAR